jgi:hypothetical protein
MCSLWASSGRGARHKGIQAGEAAAAAQSFVLRSWSHCAAVRVAQSFSLRSSYRMPQMAAQSFARGRWADDSRATACPWRPCLGHGAVGSCHGSADHRLSLPAYAASSACHATQARRGHPELTGSQCARRGFEQPPRRRVNLRGHEGDPKACLWSLGGGTSRRQPAR